MIDLQRAAQILIRGQKLLEEQRARVKKGKSGGREGTRLLRQMENTVTNLEHHFAQVEAHWKETANSRVKRRRATANRAPGEIPR